MRRRPMGAFYVRAISIMGMSGKVIMSDAHITTVRIDKTGAHCCDNHHSSQNLLIEFHCSPLG